MLSLLSLAAASLLPALAWSASLANGKSAPSFRVERITTKASFPRGIQLVDGSLYVLCRGRVRDYGGVSAAVDDQAGTIYRIDPGVAELFQEGDPGNAVRENGVLLAEPTAPPFRLWDRSASPAWKDRETDRPYCGLSWHPPTQSFYICAFSGVDRDEKSGKTFSKNLSDGILRYDRRTSRWYEVERHDIDKGGIYPHQDPATSKPPHGWLNGPDNCLAVGQWLYAVSKDNSRLVRYDLRALEKDPEAGAPSSEVVFEESLHVRGIGPLSVFGHSALAYRDNWLYVGTRTSGHVVRIALDAAMRPASPRVIELVAQFDAYDPATKRSGNVTDMCFGPDGHLYLICAQPARCHRFRPDPKHLYDARDGRQAAYIDLAALTNNPKMKSENLLVDEKGRVYITSGDAYSYQEGSGGVVWRVTPES